MKINHIGIWVNDLEKMKKFYSTWFNGTPNLKYNNTNKEFESYFISFEDNIRIELMKMKDHNTFLSKNNNLGLAHLAFSLGSKELVDDLTQKMKAEGVKILNGPRRTGDGYYESLISDPEGNEIELTE